jgi:membrane-associated phospholipid phosphatase
VTPRTQTRRRPGAGALAPLAVAIPLAVFAALAVRVARGGGFGWDGPIESFLRGLRHVRFTERGTQGLVDLGMVAGILAAAAILVLLLARGQRLRALFWTLSIGGAAAISPLLKQAFQRPPPGHDGSGYSFPSGNATLSMAAVAAAILLTPQLRRSVLALLLAAVAVVAYGLALVLLHWHHPSDVLAGWCVALAWVSGLWLVLRRRFPPLELHAPVRRYERRGAFRSS